jgi:hypothetical protein
MNRQAYLEKLETRALTNNQQGRIMAEFERLGFDEHDDRDERLDICSYLIGRSVDTTWEMHMGEAGKLVGTLQKLQTLDDLYALLPETFWLDEQEDEAEAEDTESPGEMFAAGWRLISRAMRTWLT